MAAIHIPDRRFRQPADIVGLHPDWEGRVASLIHFGAGAPVDVVDHRANYIRSGAAQIEPARPGVNGLRTGAGGTTEGYIESANALASFSGAPTLVFFFSEIAATQGVSGGMLYAIPAAGSYTQLTPDGSSLYVLGGDAKSLGEDMRGTRNRSLIVRAAGSTPSVFIDRKKVAGATGSIGAGAKTIRIGMWTSANWQFNGVYGSIAVIAGAITDDEAYQLVDNPWGLYEIEQEVVYFDFGGGSSPNLAASGSATASGTATPAGDIALAGVGVSLATGAASLSGAGNLAASGSNTATGTAQPSIAIALSALGLSVASGTASLSSSESGNLAASGAGTAGGSAAIAASVTISASGLAQAAAQAGISADVLLAGAGAAAAAGNAALAVQLQALAQGAAQSSGTATLSGAAAGELGAYGQATVGGSALLTLDVRLQAAGGSAAGGSAALSSGSAGALAASGGSVAAGSGTIAVAVTITAAGFVQAMGAGYLVVQASLSGTGAAQAGGSAVVVDADALVLIEMPRWTIDAAGRRWVVQ